jgi:hypothetical protein
MSHSKTAFAIISFFCSTLFLRAQTPTEKWDKYSEIAFTYYDNGKWVDKVVSSESGYANETIFIDRVLKKITADFYFIRVKKKNKYGWTNTLGELLIPIEYDGGLFGAMRSKLICVKKKEKWGCIDFKNNIVIPFIYDKMSSFKDDLSQVTLNGKMGYVDNKGLEVIKPVYDKTNEFVKDIAVVMKDNKYGFINKKGTVIGTISYDDAFSFDENKFGYVKIGANYGVIDSTGKLLFSDDFKEIPMAINAELFKVKKGFYFGVMNKSGKLLIDYKYHEIYKPRIMGNENHKESQLIMRVACGSKFGFVKMDGTVVSDCVFSKADDVFQGMSEVEKHIDGVTKKGTFFVDTKKFQLGIEVADPVYVDTPSNSGPRNNSTSGSDKKTIKNTGKNQLYIKAGNSTSRLNGGSSSTFSCKDAIYYCNDDGKGNHTVKGALISGANEDCGKTVTAVGGN